MNRFKFYRSKEWDNLRKIIISERVNEFGDSVCELCGKAIVNKYDLILHHVNELTESNVLNVDVSLSPDNLQILCRDCHNKVHERFGHVKAKSERGVYIVWGSPCAGKSTWVYEHAGNNDLIVDIDRIMEAICFSDSKRLMSNVMQIYRQLIDMVKTRNGQWQNAYIMRTLPLSVDRESLLRECGGGELIHIDTPKEVCIERAKARGGEAVKYTEKYWEYYQPEK